MLNEREPVQVKALFFAPVDFQQLVPVSYIPIAEPYVKLKENEKKLVHKSMELFTSLCKANNMK